MEHTGITLEIPTTIYTIANFIIFFILVKHFFWEKISHIIEERQNEIEEKISKADEDSEKARMFLLQNQRILKNAKKEGKKITEEQKKKADKIYDEIIDEAKEEAQSLIERAKLEITREKEKAEYEVKKQAVDIAVELSIKALNDQIDENLHRKLINDFITKVGM